LNISQQVALEEASGLSSQALSWVQVIVEERFAEFRGP
jgi:hypothetical protein